MGVRDYTDGEKRMSKCRTGLLINSPWFGHLAMKLKIREVYWLDGTVATDGTNLFFNPHYIAGLSDIELKAVMAHEVMHCALGHMFRIGDRDIEEWNIACDFAINPLLLEANFTLPKDVLYDPKYKDKDDKWMTAERIYSERQKEAAQSGQPRPKKRRMLVAVSQPGSGQSDDSDDSGDGQPQTKKQRQQKQQQQRDQFNDKNPAPNNHPSTGRFDRPPEDDSQDLSDGKGEEEEKRRKGNPQNGSNDADSDQEQDGDQGGDQPDGQSEDEGDGDGAGMGTTPLGEADWQAAVAMATSITSKMPGKMPAGVAAAAEASQKTEPDCWEVLRRFISQNVVTNTSWSRPNRKMMAAGVFWPGPIKEGMPRIAFGNDTSGSISAEICIHLVAQKMTEIMHEFRPESLDVYHCDAMVHEVEEFTPDDGEVVFKKCAGRGGTSFQPVFDEIMRRHEEEGIDLPCCCLYFSEDLANYDPGGLIEPPYPVLWITNDTHDEVGEFGETIRISHPEYRYNSY